MERPWWHYCAMGHFYAMERLASNQRSGKVLMSMAAACMEAHWSALEVVAGSKEDD